MKNTALFTKIKISQKKKPAFLARSLRHGFMFRAVFSVLFLFAFASCSFWNSDSGSSGSGSSGSGGSGAEKTPAKGTVRISFSTLPASRDGGFSIADVAPSDITKAILYYCEIDTSSGSSGTGGSGSSTTPQTADYTELKTWEKDSGVKDDVEGDTSLTLNVGSYFFKLELYTGTGDTKNLCQRGYIPESTNTPVRIDEGENTLTFNTKYVSGGNGSLISVLSWSAPGVSTVKAGLFTAVSDGTVAVEGFGFEPISVSDDGAGNYSSTYTKTSIKEGTYFINYELYDSDGLRINTLGEIIKIETGCQTTGAFSLPKINTQYTITYAGEGETENDYWKWKAGFTPVVKRNSHKAVLLPGADVMENSSQPDAIFIGWYENADFSGTPVSSISSGNAENRTFYPRWFYKKLYVNGADGLDTKDGVTAQNPLKTIDHAIELFNTWGTLSCRDTEASSSVHNQEEVTIKICNSVNENVKITALNASKLTIEGNSGSQKDILDGNTDDNEDTPDGEALYIAVPKNFEFKNLKITNGKGKTASDFGGVFIANGANVLIQECEITGNASLGNGGGVFITGTSTKVSIISTIITHNTAAGSGGGLYADAGVKNLQVKSTGIEENTATGASSLGGGVYCAASGTVSGNKWGEEVLFSGCYINKNEAIHGSGLYIPSNTVVVIRDGEINENHLYTGTVAGIRTGTGAGIHTEGKLLLDSVGINCNLFYEGADYGPSYGAGLYAAYGSEVYLCGSTNFSKNQAMSEGSQGGGIYLRGAKLFMSDEASIGKINDSVTGHAVYDFEEHFENYAKSHGGGIFATGASEIYMGYSDADTPDDDYTGGICYNYSYYCGGGVYMEGTTQFFIHKGTIKYNASRAEGGAIRMGGTADVVTMENGSIEENFSGSSGTYTDGVITGEDFSSSSTHYGNSKGAGVYVGGSSTFNMAGGKISKNQASNGAGIYSNGGSVSITGGTVSENISGVNGGGFYSNGGTVSISGGTVSKNISGVNGGAIYFNGGTVTISGGTVSANIARGNGGGFYIAYNADASQNSFSVSDGTISANKAFYTTESEGVVTNVPGCGGAAFVSNGAILNLSGKASFPYDLSDYDTNENDVYLEKTTLNQITDSAVIGVSSFDSSYTGTVCLVSLPEALYMNLTKVLSGAAASLATYSSKFALNQLGDGEFSIQAGVLYQSASAPVEITITDSSPEIEVTKAETASSVTITAPSGLGSYKWYVNDVLKTEHNSQNTATFDISDWAPGIYDIRMEGVLNTDFYSYFCQIEVK